MFLVIYFFYNQHFIDINNENVFLFALIIGYSQNVTPVTNKQLTNKQHYMCKDYWYSISGVPIILAPFGIMIILAATL